MDKTTATMTATELKLEKTLLGVESWEAPFCAGVCLGLCNSARLLILSITLSIKLQSKLPVGLVEDSAF